jgi:hypothetical protein
MEEDVCKVMAKRIYFCHPLREATALRKAKWSKETKWYRAK